METESHFCTFVENCSHLTNIQKSGFSGDQYSWNSRTVQSVMMFWIRVFLSFVRTEHNK